MVSPAFHACAAALAEDLSPGPDNQNADARCLDLEIVNRLGLHARAAAKFVKTASAFASDITVSHQGQTVSGRSIMGLMMLAASRGTTIRVTACGPDSAEALREIGALVSGRFHEAE